jgi:Carboxypeptidase regulatory-like domain
VQRTFRLAALAAGAASLLAAGLAATPAIAAPASAHNHGSRGLPAAHLPISARQLLADQQLHNRASGATGAVTGQALSPSGAPLRDVCVSAYGPGGVRSAATRADGQYLITGLRPGSYRLRYFGCGDSAQYQAQWLGGAAQESGSRSVAVNAAGLAPVAPVTMQTLAEQSGTADVINPVSPASAAQSLRVALGLPVYGASSAATLPEPAVVQAAKGGRIAGVVTDPQGRGLKGICVVADTEGPNATEFGFGLAVTGKTGRYRIARLPAGRYEVVFYAGCGNTGNWLVQVYKDRVTLKKPTSVRVRRGKTTSGVDATLQPGGEISGTITGKAGAKLSGVCVEPIAPGPRLVLGAVSTRGSYHLRGLPAGTYRLDYIPCGPPSIYTSSWWHDVQSESRAQKLHLKTRQQRTGINEIMPVGGVISGTVTNTSNAPIKGICVFAGQAFHTRSESGFYVDSEASTNGAGKYKLFGLATGSYQIQFQLGCPNNGNYLAANYPSHVFIRDGQAKAGINQTLQAGAIVSGLVTSAATGKPLPGICVDIESLSDSSNFNSNFNFTPYTQSGSGGGYKLDQLPPGSYEVTFSGGCGNGGSYAPQGDGDTSAFTPKPIKITAPGQSVTGIGAAMQPGATITGTVTGPGRRKLSGICVYTQTESGLGGEANSANGRYQIRNLLPGQYQVSFTPGCSNNADLGSVSFGSSVNPPLVSAPAGTTSGIDGVLPAAGNISGTVRSKSGKAVAGACVDATGLTPATQADSYSDEGSGSSYKLTGLAPGPYLVTFQPNCSTNRYENQWYKDKPSPAGAARVEVRAGHTTAGISSALIKAGSIAGTITSGGKPVRNACVYAQSTSQVLDYGSGLTDKAGKYVVGGLNSGTYELEVQLCDQNNLGPGAGLVVSVLPRLVKVRAPRRVSGVNASLAAAGSISGSVLGGSPPVGQPYMCVEALGTNSDAFGLGLSDTSGKFTIADLPPGKYEVYLGAALCSDGNNDLAPQWYPGQQNPTSASVVLVKADKTTALASVTLPTDGAVAGSVTGPGGSAVAGICVTATATKGGEPVVAVTRGDGYSILGLVPGTYRVEFASGCGASGYQAQWWHAKSSERTATIITVKAATTTAGITAALQK